MGIEEFPSAPPQQPGKRANHPPPANQQVMGGFLIILKCIEKSYMKNIFTSLQMSLFVI